MLRRPFLKRNQRRRPVVPDVSRETEEEQPVVADHGNSDAEKERTKEDLAAASADAGTEASEGTDAEEETADTGADDLVPVPGAPLR